MGVSFPYQACLNPNRSSLARGGSNFRGFKSLGIPGFQESFGLVTKSLSRKELLASTEALEAIRKEGEKLRRRDKWDDSSAIEPDLLCEQAKKSGTKLHIADAMTIAGIKNYEMPADKQVYKGRVAEATQ